MVHLRAKACLAVLASCLSIASATVVITAPTAATAWVQGSTQTIRWTSSSGDPTFEVDIYPADGKSGFTLAASIDPSADGGLQFGIGGNLTPGLWFIALYETANTTNEVAQSPNFTVLLAPASSSGLSSSAPASSTAPVTPTSTPASSTTPPSSTSSTPASTTTPNTSTTTSSTTSTTTSSTTSSSTSSTSTSASPTSSPTAAKSSHTGAIVGGVIGGVAVIGAIAALVFLYAARQKRQANLDNYMGGLAPGQTDGGTSGYGGTQYPTGQYPPGGSISYTSPSMQQSGAGQWQQPYSDPHSQYGGQDSQYGGPGGAPASGVNMPYDMDGHPLPEPM